MNNNWENSWKAKKITKEIINSLDMLQSTKDILIERFFSIESSCFRLIELLKLIEIEYDLSFSLKLFAHFVKNGIIELDEVVNN
jgi:hypothetical protein